jgi:hypothetical protein
MPTITQLIAAYEVISNRHGIPTLIAFFARPANGASFLLS